MRLAVYHAVAVLDGGMADGLGQVTFASAARTHSTGITVRPYRPLSHLCSASFRPGVLETGVESVPHTRRWLVFSTTKPAEMPSF